MPLKVKPLAVVGTLLLVAGLYLAVTGQRWSTPGLVLVAGGACWAIFLLVNEPAWNRPEPPPGDDSPPAPEAG
jgi:drug/metabolite transporter (DMT)-like permease